MEHRAPCSGSTILVFMAGVTLFQSQAAAQQPDLRYKWEKGKQFAYEVTVTVDAPTSVTTYKGITRYTVDAPDDKQSQTP